MKSTAEILELLRIYKTQFASKYGFKRLGVFGSVARGEQTEQSDVDVCYEGEPRRKSECTLIRWYPRRFLRKYGTNQQRGSCNYAGCA